MGMPIANISVQGVPEKVQKVAGSFGGKLIGSIAGILIIITVLKSTFYIVKVGQRGVLLRRGMPVLKKNGRVFFFLAELCCAKPLMRLYVVFSVLGDWRKRRQVGLYKVRRPGIWVKFPGWYDVDKVNVQKRIQKLPAFTVDCREGQRTLEIDLVTRVPCDDDGPEFADYPALKIITSSEADDVFESFCGTALVDIFELADQADRNNREWLLENVDTAVGDELRRVGYLLEGVNQRARPFTSIEKAIQAFSPPEPTISHQASVDESEAIDQSDGVVVSIHQLPHPVVTAVALGHELGEPS